jgi:hypothetical protein
VIGGRYGRYIGMIGNWANLAGCDKIVVWSSTNAVVRRRRKPERVRRLRPDRRPQDPMTGGMCGSIAGARWDAIRRHDGRKQPMVQ